MLGKFIPSRFHSKNAKGYTAGWKDIVMPEGNLHPCKKWRVWEMVNICVNMILK